MKPLASTLAAPALAGCRFPPTPTVSVVIPTLNRKSDVMECIQSLLRSEFHPLEIVVVDNGSNDNTSKAVNDTFPTVRVFRSKRNLGVTGGRNLGAKIARGDYVFFVDHDTVTDGETVKELVEVLEHDDEIGVAGPIVNYYGDPDRIWAAGTSVSLKTGKVRFNMTGEIDTGTLEDPFDVQVLPSAFMVKRDALEKVGGFDDTFFAVYEDTDFCLRIRKAGYRITCVPRSKLWHKVVRDRKGQELAVLARSYYIARNRTIFMKKHASTAAFVLFLMLFLPTYAIYYMANCVRLGTFTQAGQYLRGMIDGLKNSL